MRTSRVADVRVEGIKGAFAPPHSVSSDANVLAIG